MGVKWYCDLCDKFIAEVGPSKGERPNKQFIISSYISSYYESKSTAEDSIGWSGPNEKIEFWACDECNRKFMDAVLGIARSLGYNK